MNSATWVKFLAGVLLFGAWLTLVLMRIVPPGPLVDAIGYALVGLGIYHASANGSSPAPSALLASLLTRLTPISASTQTVASTQAAAATASTQPSTTEPALASAPVPVAAQPAAGTLQ